MKRTFRITEIGGASCASQVEKRVRALDGVLDVSLNMVTGDMRVSFDEDEVTPGDIIAAVAATGYVARAREKRPDGEKKREKHRLRAHLVLVWLFSLLILYLIEILVSESHELINQILNGQRYSSTMHFRCHITAMSNKHGSESPFWMAWDAVGQQQSHSHLLYGRHIP